MNNVVIVCASHRRDSQSLKVANFFSVFTLFKSKIINLIEFNIPFWDETIGSDSIKWESWFKIEKDLTSADGFIFISPEYGGMVTPILKNFMLLCTQKHFAHKPCLLTSVSAARGGAYPISELRMSSYKNNLLVYLPEHLIIRNVNHVLNKKGHSQLEEEDKYLRERIDYAVNLLNIYTTTFKEMRAKNLLLSEKYTNGM